MEHIVIRMTNAESIKEVYDVLKEDCLNILSDFTLSLELAPKGFDFSIITVVLPEWASKANVEKDVKWVRGIAWGILMARQLPVA